MKQNPGLSKEDEEIPAESEVPYDLGARRGSNYKTPMERSEWQKHLTMTLDLQMPIVQCTPPLKEPIPASAEPILENMFSVHDLPRLRDSHKSQKKLLG